MKVADGVMAGKASDSSIKWQLCYDMSARTWWMVSWCENFFSPPKKAFFFFLFSFSPPFLSSSFTAAVHMLTCCKVQAVQSFKLQLGDSARLPNAADS